MGKFSGNDTTPGWINRKFHKIEREMRELRARRLDGTEVDAGHGFTIRGVLNVIGSAIVNGLIDLTGNLTVRDAGNIDVRDEGLVRWYDSAGRLRFVQGRVAPDGDPGGDRIRIVYQDTAGEDRIIIGEIADEDTGELLGHGILVEDGDGSDILTARQNKVRLGRPDGSSILYAEVGQLEDLWLHRADGRSTIELSGEGSDNAIIWGGSAASGTGMACALIFTGSTPDRELRVRDARVFHQGSWVRCTGTSPSRAS